MYEIRLHGLGGEGVVRLSNMIGKAALKDEKWAHSLPFFGTEIRGAAVKAFARVSDWPISVKSYIYEPDVIIMTNDLLLDDPETLQGLKKDGILIINTTKRIKELKKITEASIFPINATKIAYEIMGRPIVNTIIFGSLIGNRNLVSLDSALATLWEEFSPQIGKLNIAAFEKGYQETRKVT